MKPAPKVCLLAALALAAPAQQPTAPKKQPTIRRTDSITVSAEADRVSVEASENAAAERIDASLLEKLPVEGNDAIGAALLLADPLSAGAGGVSILIDGAESRDGKLRLSEIQEIRINSNPYSAEFRRPGRGRIEIITKRVEREHHGELRFSLRDSLLNARPALAASKPGEHRRDLEGAFSGPLRKPWAYSLGFERESQQSQAQIRARIPAGEIRQNFPQPEMETSVTGRLDSSSASFRYEYGRDQELGQGVGGVSLPSAAFDAFGEEHHVRVQYRRALGGKLFWENTVETGWHGESVASRDAGPRLVVEDAFVTGGAQREERNRVLHAGITSVASWIAGRHQVRGGAALPDIRRESLADRSNFGGTLTYASLTDFEAGRAMSITQNTGDPSLQFHYADAAAFVQDDIRLGRNAGISLGLRYDWQGYLEDRNNFSPRAAIAYSPARRIVLRAGAGTFYDQTGLSPIRDQLRFDGVRLRQLLAVPGTEPSQIPSNIVRFGAGVSSPSLIQFSGGADVQVHLRSKLSMMYTRMRGRRLFRSIDANAPAPPDYKRPDAATATIRELTSGARLSGHSLETAFRGTLARWFQGSIAYTLSSAWDDSGGASWLPPDSLDLSQEWARSSSLQRHRFRITGAADAWLGIRAGIQFEAASGRPYEMTLGQDSNRDGRAAERPEGVRRNALTAAGLVTLDLRLSREWTQKQGRLIVSADAFNLLNRGNYVQWVGNVASPLFGQPLRANGPRRFQFTCVFRF
jgi:hypothetical protein